MKKIKIKFKKKIKGYSSFFCPFFYLKKKKFFHFFFCGDCIHGLLVPDGVSFCVVAIPTAEDTFLIIQLRKFLLGLVRHVISFSNREESHFLV